MEKKLSIIIPTFNEENYLPFLLKSIITQKGVKTEIIISDNNSVDRTREIGKSFGVKIVKGGSPAQGRNRGAEIATNEILLFLDADVILPAPDFLKKTLFEFKKNNFDIATCYLYPLSNKKIDKFLHKSVNLYLKTTRFFFPHLPGCCIFVRKNLHFKINGFDESLKVSEDHDYVQKASKIGRFGILKSYPVFVSTRRLEKEGRFKIIFQYAFYETCFLFNKEILKKDPLRYYHTH